MLLQGKKSNCELTNAKQNTIKQPLIIICTMKVAMYYRNDDVRLEDMPIPEISEGEILVKVLASGICGSDVMEWYRIKKAPLVLGHETTGTVEKVGKGAKGFKKGDRVFVTHHVPCYNCHACKRGEETTCELLHNTKYYPGGFSQYLRLPKINVQNYGIFKLPKEVSFEQGSFIEPLGCVVRGQRKAGIKKGDVVLVIGTGVSGILHIQAAKARGAAKVFGTARSQFHLDSAKKFGAILINANENVPEKIKQLNGGKLADVVIVCAGSQPALEQGLACVENGGAILFYAPADPNVSLNLDMNDVWKRGIKMLSSYAAAREDLEEALELIKKKKVNVSAMITHRLPLKEAQKGFQLTAHPQDSLKVIIEPWK